MAKDWWKPHSWNAKCDRCGFKRKADQLKETWDHLMVCEPTKFPGCWEPRHSQDIARPPVQDQKPLPWTRPEPADSYVVDLQSLMEDTVVERFMPTEAGETDVDEVGFTHVNAEKH